MLLGDLVDVHRRDPAQVLLWPLKSATTRTPEPSNMQEALMSFRFRKSFKVLPGVRLNVNGRSMSVTLGAGRVHETISTTGRRTTSVRIGEGVSYRKTSRKKHH